MNSRLNFRNTMLIALTMVLVSSTVRGQDSATMELASETSAIRNELRSLAPFVEENANVFLLYRPSVVINSKSWEGLSRTMDDPAIKELIGEIELMVATIDGTSILMELMPIFPGAGGEPEKRPLRYSIFVRTTKEISSARIIELVNSPATILAKGSSAKYRSIEWKGREIIGSKNKEAPVIVRIDDRSFVVGDPASIRSGLKDKRDLTVHNKLWEILETHFDSEMLAAVDTQKLAIDSDKYGLSVPDFFHRTNSGMFSLGFSKGDLLNLQVDCVDESAMQEARNNLEALTNISKFQMQGQSSEWNPENGANPMDDYERILDSITFESTGNSLSVKVPRPDNWDEILERAASAGTQKYEAFEEIPMETQNSE